MDAREHIAAGEDHLDIADTKNTYSEASAHHVARAHAHFAAATAYLLLDTQPLELVEAEGVFDFTPGAPVVSPKTWCARCGHAYENGAPACDCAGDRPVDPEAEPKWQRDYERRVEALRYTEGDPECIARHGGRP